MTIKECIDIIDNLKPNQYSIKEKVMWLSFIDEIIINDVLKTHEGYDGRYDEFTGYTEEKTSVALIVPSPYDRLYPAYLQMKIDGANGETARYNNSAAEFNAYMMEYKKYYHKTHMPLSKDAKPKVRENPSYNITDAMYENLKRELYAQLSEEFADATSKDKLYSIVTEYIQNNLEMLMGITDSQTSKISSVTLFADRWYGSTSRYSQVVSVSGATRKSKIDLNPTVEQLEIFYNKDVTFVIENDNGVLTAHCIGQKPTSDYTMQVTITEVATNG
jgi:hypothetical protein